MLLVVEMGFRFVPRKKAFLKIRTLQGFGFPIFPIQNYVNHRCLMLGSPISTKHQMLIVNRLTKATPGCKVLRFYNDLIGISKNQQTGMFQKISGTQRQGVSCGSYFQLILHRNKQNIGTNKTTHWFEQCSFTFSTQMQPLTIRPQRPNALKAAEKPAQSAKKALARILSLRQNLLSACVLFLIFAAIIRIKFLLSLCFCQDE